MRSIVLFALVVRLALPACGQNMGNPKFYPDDPLTKAPAPIPAKTVKLRKISDIYDYFLNDFGKPGEHWEKGQPGTRAKNVNTVGEVPDDEWYQGRHYFRPMTLEELQRGPDQAGPPSREGMWKVVGAKTEGITPGFTIVDQRGGATSSSSTRSNIRRSPPRRT